MVALQAGAASKPLSRIRLMKETFPMRFSLQMHHGAGSTSGWDARVGAVLPRSQPCKLKPSRSALISLSVGGVNFARRPRGTARIYHLASQDCQIFG